MDSRVVGRRIKAVREAKNMSQEDLAALADLSATHISVIERGTKSMRIDNFVMIANALGVSADYLLLDVVDHSAVVTNELNTMLNGLPKEERKRVVRALEAYMQA